MTKQKNFLFKDFRTCIVDAIKHAQEIFLLKAPSNFSERFTIICVTNKAIPTHQFIESFIFSLRALVSMSHSELE